jgi:hypothetical protein
MKKTILYFALLASVVAACDPIEDRDTLSGNVALDDLQLSCIPTVVDSKNSNEVIVENNSPLLSRWISDRTQIEKAYGTVIFDYTGNKNVQFTGLNGDGTKIETTIPVRIDTITNIKSDFVSRLGIKYKSDGTVDKTSQPYYFGNVSEATIKSKILVEQVVVNGKKGNVLKVKNSSPVLSDWNWGGVTSNKNSVEELFVTSVGEFELTFKGTKADGSIVNFSLGKYTVDSLTKIPQEYLDLFGDFIADPNTSKTWQWNRSEKVWSIGPYQGFTDPNVGWWNNGYADMTSRQDGTMTFKFSDLSLTKDVTTSNATDTKEQPNTTYKGTVAVDLGTKVSGYSVGTVKLNGVTILYGIDVNGGNAPWTTLSLVKVSGNTLILGGDQGNTWLYRFEAVK